MEFKEIFISLLMDATDGNQTKFSKLTGIPIPTINGWLTKNTLPRAEQLIMLSNFFNVSVDCLLGLEELPKIVTCPSKPTNTASEKNSSAPFGLSANSGEKFIFPSEEHLGWTPDTSERFINGDDEFNFPSQHYHCFMPDNSESYTNSALANKSSDESSDEDNLHLNRTLSAGKSSRSEYDSSAKIANHASVKKPSSAFFDKINNMDEEQLKVLIYLVGLFDTSDKSKNDK